VPPKVFAPLFSKSGWEFEGEALKVLFMRLFSTFSNSEKMLFPKPDGVGGVAAARIVHFGIVFSGSVNVGMA